MKKLIIIFFVLISSISYCQELNSSAIILKNDKTDSYNAIKKFAVTKWDAEHDMIVYEINKQAEAFFDVLELFEGNKEIFSQSVLKWGENVTADNLLKNSTVDWSMVLYEMKKQIKAEKAY